MFSAASSDSNSTLTYTRKDPEAFELCVRDCPMELCMVLSLNMGTPI